MNFNSPPEGWLDDWRLVTKRRVVLRGNHDLRREPEYREAASGSELQRGRLTEKGLEWVTIEVKLGPPRVNVSGEPSK